MKHLIYIFSLLIVLPGAIIAADSHNVIIEKSILQNELLILPKVSLKTNEYKVALTIYNRSTETIYVKINPKVPGKIAKLKSKIKDIVIDPNHFEILNYDLRFEDVFFGHLLSENFKITFKNGKNAPYKNPKSEIINIKERNLPKFLIIHALLAQMIFILPYFYWMIYYLSSKMRLRIKNANRFYYWSCALVIIALGIYDFYHIY